MKMELNQKASSYERRALSLILYNKVVEMFIHHIISEGHTCPTEVIQAGVGHIG